MMRAPGQRNTMADLQVGHSAPSGPVSTLYVRPHSTGQSGTSGLVILIRLVRNGNMCEALQVGALAGLEDDVGGTGGRPDARLKLPTIGAR